MPYQWTAERERFMLLVAIGRLNSKPSNDTWEEVARILGEGLTTSAVSQKYYKMKKEAIEVCKDSTTLTPPATPTKRKGSILDGRIGKPKSTPKRTKKFEVKKEGPEGETIRGPAMVPMYFTGEQNSQVGYEAVSMEDSEGGVIYHRPFTVQDSF